MNALHGNISTASGASFSNTEFVGTSAYIHQLLKTADDVSSSDAPVLITGECGTGKEVLARRIHAQSQRSGGPYVSVNCGAVAGSLEESELFGYVPGAFTGAAKRKQGLFEAANHGTVFLDEIGEANTSLQVKLLRVLQDGEYVPVGSARNHHCDVRVIAATNVNLDMAVDRGDFRADLYYRLDVVRLYVPPLRERMEDVPLLVHHFAARYAKRYGIASPEIHPDFLAKLLRFKFPGNVRELSNYVHRAVVLGCGAPLTAELLSKCPVEDSRSEPSTSSNHETQILSPTAGISFHEAKKYLIETFEREYLLMVLKECGGIICRAARRAGMSERGFHQKLKRYGIDGTSFRGGK